MNSKRFSLIFILAVCISTASFSLDAAIGVQYSFIPRFTSATINSKHFHFNESSASLAIKMPIVPVIFFADILLDGYKFQGLQVSGDWWVKNNHLTQMLYYYYGLGCAISVRFPELKFSSFEIGARAFAGLNIYLYEPLEVYVQATLQPSFTVYTTGLGFSLPVPLSLGIRYWF